MAPFISFFDKMKYSNIKQNHHIKAGPDTNERKRETSRHKSQRFTHLHT